MKWIDSLKPDEAPLLGRDPNTDILLFRLAHERKAAESFWSQLQRLKPPQRFVPTAKDLEWAASVSERCVPGDKLRKECSERGGCAWGPITVDDSEPMRKCPHCGSGMYAMDQRIVGTPA